MAPRVLLGEKMLEIKDGLEMTHQLQVQKLKGRNDILEKQSKQNLDQLVKFKERIS